MSTGRFTFRLQRLLALRQMAERAAAIALGSAQEAASKTRSTRVLLAGRRAEVHATMLLEPGRARCVGELQRAAILEAQLDTQVSNATLAMNTSEQRVRDARERLRGRIQERRVLERLRERHLATWAHDVRHDECETMDSITRSPAATQDLTATLTGT